MIKKSVLITRSCFNAKKTWIELWPLKEDFDLRFSLKDIVQVNSFVDLG